LTLTKSFSELGLISGASVDQMKNATLQLSQGLTSGKFQAEEFNSVIENVPLTLNYIAEGMGITTAQLIQMKREGELLSKDVFDALISQAEAITKQAEQMPMRLSRGFQRLQLGINLALTQIDETNSITLKLGGILAKAGEEAQKLPFIFEAMYIQAQKFMDENAKLKQFIVTFAGLYGSIFAVNVALSVTRGLMLLITRANPFILIATSVITFYREILAASQASQKLFTALEKFFNFDLSGAKDELLGIKQAYQNALKVETENDSSPFENLNKTIENLMKTISESLDNSIDLNKLDLTKGFLNEIERLQSEYRSKEIEQANKQKEKLNEIEKEKSFVALKWAEYKANVKKSFLISEGKENRRASAEEIQNAGNSFRALITQSSQYSKQAFEINKALSMAQLAMKTPTAIGNAYTFGTGIGGPLVGGIFGATAGAFMGSQIAGVSKQQFTPRAIGGDVFGGGNYLVGENGPELLQLGSRGGHITPNHQLGSMNNNYSPKINVTVHNAQNQTATVQSNENNGNIDIDIFLKTIENNIVSGINQGDSTLAKTIENTYKLSRQGAFA
jgi:tape measure domain-containing protein